MTKRLLVVVACSLGLAGGCGDDAAKPGGVAGTGGSGGTAALDAGGQGGTGGNPDGGGAMDVGTGGTTGATGGTAGAGTGGAVADAGAPDAVPSSMMITASAGGTLTGGGATLQIPAGGIGADKLLTLSVRAPATDEPGRANILGDIFEFGPDGTTFTVPVALTLPIAVTVPADKKVVVAWLDTASGQWFPVPSIASVDKVVGRISHFTRLAALQIPKDEMCPYAGGCGGSLEGTWKYTQGCLKPEEKDAVPCGAAGNIKLRQEYNIGGTVTFAAGRFDANQMLTVTATLFYTPACMGVLRESMPALDCATLQAAWRKENVQPGMPENPWICAGTVADGCACQLTQAAMQKVMGAFAVAGPKVTFTQDTKPAGMPDDFCVQGTNLSVRTAKGDVYTAVKQ